jgi:zinc transport system substrate-binding protein
MNKNQKIFVGITVVIIIALFAYGIVISYQQERADEGKVDVVVTFYPLAYMTEEIGGEHVTVDTLVPYNSEIHSWQPSTTQIVSADEADILIYNGAEVDHWFEEDILPVIDKSNKLVIESVEGIELLETEEHEEGENESEEDEHDHGLHDPHTWISPYLAVQQAENIYDALVETDPENEAIYTANWNKLRTKFEELDQEYMTSLANKSHGEIFVSHAAFGHLANRYEFEQHGVIGLSADEQPSTSTIAGLIEEMVEHDVFVVYVDPVYSDDFAQTIKSEVERETGEDVKILKLYFMLGPTDGLDYIEQMEENLENLKIGLGVQE